MNTATAFQSAKPKKKKINPRNILGGILEDTFETITGTGSGYTNEGPVNPEQFIQTARWNEIKKGLEAGSLADFQTPKTAEKTEKQLRAEQQAAIAEAEHVLRQFRAETVTQEEISKEVNGLSEEERNRMLSLSTSLRKKHTEDPYHIAELYRELKVELLMAKKRREMTEIPNPAKATAMNAAFEGGAGTQGGGTANLSFRATG